MESKDREGNREREREKEKRRKRERRENKTESISGQVLRQTIFNYNCVENLKKKN